MFCGWFFFNLKKILTFVWLENVLGNVKVKMVWQAYMTDEISLVNSVLTTWSNDENGQ